jgi:hypothetical protein
MPNKKELLKAIAEHTHPLPLSFNNIHVLNIGADTFHVVKHKENKLLRTKSQLVQPFYKPISKFKLHNEG